MMMQPLVQTTFGGKTCSTCLFWKKGETDPLNLAAPPPGECRESVHLIALHFPDGVQLVTAYAKAPAGFDACGRYREKQEDGFHDEQRR